MAVCVSLSGAAAALNYLKCRSPTNMFVRVFAVSSSRNFSSSAQKCYFNGVNTPCLCISSASRRSRPTNGFRTSRRQYFGEPGQQRPPDTNVVKDVLLYENKNFTFHRVMGMFAIAQFTFWGYLAHFAYSEMRVWERAELSVYGEKGAPEEKKKKFSFAGLNFHLGSPYWRHGMITLCLGMGSLIVSAVILYSRRNIYRLILRKGGQRCTVIPFGFYGRARHRFTVPLVKMTCLHSRDTARSNLPIKIKGHRFFYLLDKRGKFYNARLFDFTAGMKRMID